MTDTNSTVPITDPSEQNTFCAPSRKTAGQLSEIYKSIHHEAVRLHNLRSSRPEHDPSVKRERQLCLELGTTAFHLGDTMWHIAKRPEMLRDKEEEYHARLHKVWKLQHTFSASNVPEDIKKAFEPFVVNKEDTRTALFQSLVGSFLPTVCSKKARAYFEPQESVEPEAMTSDTKDGQQLLLLIGPWCGPECASDAPTDDASAPGEYTGHERDLSTCGH